MTLLGYYGLSRAIEKLSLKAVLILSLFFVAEISVLGYLQIGPILHYDATTMWITLALCVLLAVGLIKSDAELFPMLAVLTVFLLLFVFTRVLSFLYFSERATIPLSVFLSIQQLNAGYAYILLGVAALFIGFFMAFKLVRKLLGKGSVVSGPLRVYPFAYLMLVFLISCMGQIYITLWLGNSVLGDMYYGVKYPWVGVIAVLLGFHQALVVALVSLFMSRERGEAINWKLFLIISAFILTTIMLGSRSGGIWIIEVTLVAMLTLRGNFNEYLRIFFGFIFVIVLVSIISFPVATLVRTNLIAERDSMSAQGELKSQLPKSKSMLEKLKEDEPLIATGGEMLNRLGAAFDTTVMTIALEPDHSMMARAMNLPYALKSAVNVIVPGVIFEEAQTNTALLWPFIYKLRNDYLLQNNYYESFIWSAWGVAYAMFGYEGGLAAMMVMGFILQSAYMTISRWGGELRPYFLVWFLLSVFSFYSMMGLDDFLVTMQRYLFSLILVFSMLWGIERLVRLRIFSPRGDDV